MCGLKYDMLIKVVKNYWFHNAWKFERLMLSFKLGENNSGWKKYLHF